MRDEAVRILTELCAIDELPEEKLASLNNDLGLSLRGLGKNKEAERRFRTAIELWPWTTDARENLGVSLFEAGRHQEAVRELEALFERMAETEGKPARRPRATYYLRLARRRLAGVPG